MSFTYSSFESFPDVGQNPNPSWSEQNLKANEKLVKNNPKIELGLDNYYQYIQQTLDNGVDFFYNRNEILNNVGFAIIERIVENDSQVIACIERLKLAVLQLGLTVKAKDDTPEAIELKEFWEYVFAEMKGTIQDTLYQLYSSIIYGYALSEINWKFCATGKFKGKLIIKDIKNKKPGVFQFDLDNYGNILSISNLYDSDNPLPKSKFLYYTWKKRYNNPYGVGLAETLYYLCWAKKQETKNLLRGNAKWSNPSIYIETQENPSQEEINKAVQFAEDIQNTSAGILPSPMKAQMLERAAAKGQNPSIESIQFLNTEISKCINLTEAVGMSSKNGTYGAKKVEEGSSKINEKFLIASSEDLLKEQLIRPITAINFDITKYPLDKYPDIVFNPVDEDDKNALMDRLQQAFEMGVIDTNNISHREFIQSVDGIPNEEDFNKTEDGKDEVDISDDTKDNDINISGMSAPMPVGAIGRGMNKIKSTFKRKQYE